MEQNAARSGRAIVTFSRSWQALATIRSLGSRGIEVFTGDEIELTPGSLSKYSVDSFVYPSPAADPEGFLEALEEAIERFSPETPEEPYVLLPVHRETYLIARHRDRFAGRISLALPPAGRIDQVRDKGRVAELAAELGLAAPRTWTPSDAEELERQLDEIEPPVLVKVRTGVAGVGIEKAESREQVREQFARLATDLPPGEDPPIVQALAEGDDYCVSALFDSGRARALLTYRNLRTLAENAPGAVRKTVQAAEPEAAATRLLEALEWHGIAEVDFLWTGRPGDPAYLIEVNPRMFGGLFQAIRSGVDYPWLLFRLALGEEVETPPEIDFDVTTEAPVLGFLATLREAAESTAQLSLLQRAWGSAKRQLAAGELGAGIRTLLGGLREELDREDRLEAVKELLDERETTVSQLFASEDPAAAIGLLYPLAIFLHEGRISQEALVGADAKGDTETGSR